MFAMFWPFDFSWSGFFFVGFLFMWWTFSAIGTAVKGTIEVTKKIVQNENVQEVGKGFLASWMESLFKK